MCLLTKKIFQAVLNNKDLMIGYLMVPITGGPIVMFEIYIMSWLQGFYNKETGPIYNIDKVYSLYQI